MKLWTMDRWIRFSTHLVWALVPTIIGLVASFELWSEVIGNPVGAAAIIFMLEFTAIFGLVMYIAKLPSPFIPLRHFQPFIAGVTTGLETGILLYARWSSVIQGDAKYIACAVGGLAAGGLIGTLVFYCLQAVEDCFVERSTLYSEKIRADVDGARRVFEEHRARGLELGLIGMEEKRARELGDTQEVLLLDDGKPKTIAYFRYTHGLSVAKATEAARLARAGVLTPNMLEDMKR